MEISLIEGMQSLYEQKHFNAFENIMMERCPLILEKKTTLQRHQFNPC